MARRTGVGDRFQRETCYTRDREPHEPPVATRLPPGRSYPRSTLIQLDAAPARGGDPLWQVIAARRSIRQYTTEPVTPSALSRLAWATQGITAGRGARGLRAAPSAGALYPLETYVAMHRVAGVAPGIYHYAVGRHELEQLEAGDFRRQLTDAALGQTLVRRAALVFIWSAIFDRCKREYGQRAYRYVYLDAGHAGQNLALAAAGLGLGSCPIAAFYDGEVDALIGADGEQESAVYMTAVGAVK